MNEVAKTEEANACQAESPPEPRAEAQCWALADDYVHISTCKVPSMGMRTSAKFCQSELAYICVGAIISFADPRSIAFAWTACVPSSFLGTGASDFKVEDFEESKLWHLGVLNCFGA